MIYRLKELKGDTIAVPQLVFSKLGIAEEYNVRVALYVLATGVTDPDKICADLKLRSRISAESALAFWAGAGLLERYEENAAPGVVEDFSVLIGDRAAQQHGTMPAEAAHAREQAVVHGHVLVPIGDDPAVAGIDDDHVRIRSGEEGSLSWIQAEAFRGVFAQEPHKVGDGDAATPGAPCGARKVSAKSGSLAAVACPAASEATTCISPLRIASQSASRSASLRRGGDILARLPRSASWLSSSVR